MPSVVIFDAASRAHLECVVELWVFLADLRTENFSSISQDEGEAPAIQPRDLEGNAWRAACAQ